MDWSDAIRRCDWSDCNLLWDMRVGKDDEPWVGYYCQEHGEGVIEALHAVVMAICPNCQCKIGVWP